jgi:hypothetical protein
LTEYSGNFNDLSVLSGAAELQALYLNGAKLSDISNLKMLPLLRELHIYQSAAEDFTALSALLKLERLDLNGSLIADLSPIAKAANLNWLNLSQTRIKDLKPLYDKVKLQYLSIYGNTQLKCEDIFALRSSLPASLYIQEPLQCVGAGYTLNLVNYVGSVATAEIRYVDEKYRELGELVFVNGVLTFKPKKGVSGFVSIPVWVIVGNSSYYIDVKFYVEAAKKRKKLPLWLYLTDSKP